MSTAPDRSRELSSWKEVAAYLGVSTRTAQNWEAEKELPVRRLGGARGRITITTAEIDAWKTEQFRTSETSAPARYRVRWTTRVAAAAGVFVLLSSLFWVRTGSRKPVAFRIEPQRLVVLDDQGRELWGKVLPGLSPQEAYTQGDQFGFRAFWAGDIDGDGRTEVLFRLQESNPSGSVPLVCYSQSGREKWRFVPTRLVRTRKESFDSVYRVADFEVLRVGRSGGSGIVVASIHNSFYPGNISLLSPEGKLIREYWHSGQLTDLVVADLDGDGRGEIYVAGVNNARKSATLVSLDPERFDGAAAEPEAPDYQLLGFQPPVERARLLFPRSCITETTDIYNVAYSTRVAGRSLIVVVGERPHTPQRSPSLYYELGPALNLRQVTLDDGFPLIHSELEAQKVLDHALSASEINHLRDIKWITPLASR